MIKMCDLPRYADADMEEIKKMKEAHTVLNQVTYEPKPLYHGYTDKRLRINVTDNTIDMIDIPQEVKETVNSIFSELANDDNIRQLYEKWCSLESLPALSVGCNEAGYKVELSGKCHYHVGRTDCRNYAVRRYWKMPGMQHFTDDRYPD